MLHVAEVLQKWLFLILLYDLYDNTTMNPSWCESKHFYLYNRLVDFLFTSKEDLFLSYTYIYFHVFSDFPCKL